MRAIVWYAETMSLIIRHCPRWLFVLWLVSVGAWWVTVFLYPSMAWPAFDLWARLFFGSLVAAELLFLLCWAVAALIKRRKS